MDLRVEILVKALLGLRYHTLKVMKEIATLISNARVQETIQVRLVEKAVTINQGTGLSGLLLTPRGADISGRYIGSESGWASSA